MTLFRLVGRWLVGSAALLTFGEEIYFADAALAAPASTASDIKTPFDWPPCARDSPNRQSSEAALSLRVFRDPTLSEQSTWQEIRTIQAYWSRYGVQLELPQQIEVLKRPVWLSGYANDLAEPRRNNKDKGHGANEVTRLRQVVLAHFQDFWKRNLPANDAEIWFVLTPHLVQPGTLLDGTYRNFHGLGLVFDHALSSFGAQSAHSHLQELMLGEARNISLPPTLLLVPRSKHGDPFVGAHELGHILGLRHQDSDAALMSTLRKSECRPILLAGEQDIALKNLQRYIKAKNQGEETAQP